MSYHFMSHELIKCLVNCLINNKTYLTYGCSLAMILVLINTCSRVFGLIFLHKFKEEVALRLK